MQTEQPKKHQSQSDFNFNLKVIMWLVALEVIILVCISFVKIYVDKEHNITNRMRDEVGTLGNIFTKYTDHSSEVLHQIANSIKYEYNNPEKINQILSGNDFIDQRKFFGWNGFYWLDADHIIKNTNNDCSLKVGTNLSHLANVVLSKIYPGKIFHSPNPSSSKDEKSFFDLALGVSDESGNFLGTILLQMQSLPILEDLEIYKKNNFTEFAIVDSRLNIIVSYPINANRIGFSGKTVENPELLKAITKINFFSNNEKEFSKINMLTGVNYLAKKIRNKPYLMIVSLEPEYIQSVLTQKIGLKFIEITILATFFLILVILVYKRETWLRAKAEKASQLATKAMVAKSDFLSYTAHEIRSPLGFILTGSEIMNKKLFGPIPEQYEDYVSGIYHNAKLILDFINDILDERHVASGNFKLVETMCNIGDIVKKAVITNKTRFHERKISIEKIIPDNLPFVFGDERKILQALSNLLSNAYKYSLDNTKITVEVKVLSNKLKLIVSDQGIGMTNDEVQIALTKYGTVHAGKSTSFIESYGLGLPIVIMLTKAHEATLDIRSEVGRGTTITITFPERRIIRQLSENTLTHQSKKAT